MTPEIKLNLVSTQVECQVRKLNVSWEPCSIQNMEYYNSFIREHSVCKKRNMVKRLKCRIFLSQK